MSPTATLVALALAAQVAGEVAPPRLLRDSPAQRPAGETAHGTVVLDVQIATDGRVARVQVVEPISPALDEAALLAATHLLFTPAMQAGEPIAAIIRYRYRFEPPPPPPGRLSGEVRQRGRNHRLAGASVIVEAIGDPSRSSAVDADGGGRFSVELAPGEWKVTAAAPGLRPASARVAIESQKAAEVTLFLEPEGGAFEAVIEGERPKREVSRLDLTGQELRSVPGTMGGDPFRAILALPGVATGISGVSFPIIRGAPPASTGWFLDGVRLPNLFHLFLLSAVVHPRFIDSIEFYPSAYPAQYGQLIGGIVAAKTPTGHVTELRAEANVDLLNAGAFVETPVTPWLSMAAGGRFSYLGLALYVANRIADTEGYASYWDYQTRLDAKLPGGSTLRLFVFGSHDATEAEGQRVVDTTFHRADLRWTGSLGGTRVEAGLTFGVDSVSPADQILWSRELDARLVATKELDSLTLRAGFDAQWKRVVLLGTAPATGRGGGISDSDSTFASQGIGTTTGVVGGAFAELTWTAGRFTFVPALRASLFHNYTPATFAVLEPRFAVRFRAGEGTTLKAGTGLYHQGPTTFVDLPAIDVAALGKGLQRAWHFAGGVEQRLERLGLDVDVTGYWTELPVVREPALENAIDEALNEQCRAGDCTDLFVARRGRSLGLEVMLRRKLGERLFGWIAYTLSRTTRANPTHGSLPSILDQTHILNAVASLDLGKGYSVGAGLHFHGGKPVTTIRGDVDPRDVPPGATSICTERGGVAQRCWVFDKPLDGRLPSFARLDLRFEKKWLYDRHSITFYADVLNALVAREVLHRRYDVGIGRGGLPSLVVQDEGTRLIVPMLGVKGTL